MTPHYVVFIHGMGDERKGFTRGLMQRAQEQFTKAVLRLVSQEPPADGLFPKEVHWSEITQSDQDRLWHLLFPSLRKKRDGWRELLLHPSTWIPNVHYSSSLRQFVMNYLGDPIAYAPDKPKYKEIHQAVLTQCTEIANAAAVEGATSDNPALLTVVAHSLGSVIFSDLFYELTRTDSQTAWPRQIRLANFISMGSPLALYALRYGIKPTEFTKPITMQDRSYGRWVNIYDPQDVLGYPLKPLNAAYYQAVFTDKELNAGEWWKFWQWHKQISPFSHTLYWEDETVAEIIGWKVALDWLRTNQPELEPKLKVEYEKYETWVLEK